MPDEIEPDDTDWSDADDALAARLADTVLELAREPGIHRLAAMRMAGLAGEEASQNQLAAAYGTSRRQIRAIEKRALARLRHQHPELRDDLRRWIAPSLLWWEDQ